MLGAGGLCKVMLDVLQSSKGHRVIGLLDDYVTGSFCGLPILGKMSSLGQVWSRGIRGVVLAVGDQFLQVRLRLIEAIRASNLRAVNVIHRTAWVSPSASLGAGIYVGPNATIHAGASVSDFCVIWTGSVIEHDNRIGENVFIGPSVTTAGYTEIERDVFIGIGAVVLKAKLGQLATVSAGSLVTKDVAPRTVVMGIPAKPVRRKREIAYHE